jgi:AraC-like DNA-binding protein
MKPAIELFTFENQAVRSPMVERAWRTRSEPEESFISVAASGWEMVVTQQGGAPRVTMRGPETKATMAPIPEDAEFFGIQFSPGTFMPALPPGKLVDSALTLKATTTSFWLEGSRWELPRPDHVDAFVDRLVCAGLLVHDPVAAAALRGDDRGLSTRSIERRVLRATGLTRGMIRQIRRADRAVELISEGAPPLDVAHVAGYADQSHLTRSLKRFAGRTPSEIAAASPAFTR